MARTSKSVKIGNITVGGGSRIAVQSMLNTKTADIEGTSGQIEQLINVGCDIIRFAVPDMEAADAVYEIKSRFPHTPLVADIHFDYRLALRCVEAGIDKIRINPGNIGSEDRVKAVADACRKSGVPIRIGVNGGSLEKHILEKYGRPTPQALAESAAYHVSLLEKYDFYDTVISVKSSDLHTMIGANRLIAEECDYPLHLGVTEAGTERLGKLKSAVGIGSLLCDGIGDTIRISLTDDPVKEVYAARELLTALGMGDSLIKTVSCPTCGRTRIDLISIANEFDKRIPSLKPSRPLTVAIMGCVVNGPGEARHADIGIAGGDGFAALFKNGKTVAQYPEDRILDVLCEEINKM